MMGACRAAIQDKIKFIKINGKGSKVFAALDKELYTIQLINMMKKEIMKDQLPPNRATLSEISCPLVKISFGGFNKCSIKDEEL